jgi:hypothetical protein
VLLLTISVWWTLLVILFVCLFLFLVIFLFLTLFLVMLLFLVMFLFLFLFNFFLCVVIRLAFSIVLSTCIGLVRNLASPGLANARMLVRRLASPGLARARFEFCQILASSSSALCFRQSSLQDRLRAGQLDTKLDQPRLDVGSSSSGAFAPCATLLSLGLDSMYLRLRS